MPLDNLMEKNPLKDELPDASAVNGTNDQIKGNRKPRSSPSSNLSSDTASDSTPVQDVLNEDDKALTEAQKTAKQDLVKQQAELNGRKKEQKEGSLRIHIDLDLEVEIHLTARVKGDINIGLL